MAGFTNRLKHAWNSFTDRDDEKDLQVYNSYGTTLGIRPDRIRHSAVADRTIVKSIYNRIAIDVAAVDMRHVRLDDNERYISTMPSGLNECLTVSTNIDQTGRDFRQNIVETLFEEGVAAIVPIDTDVALDKANAYDIRTMRVGTVTQWYPRHVRVKLYDDRNGRHEELTLPKENVAIIINPFYSVMNEPNSTLKRLIRKLTLLDSVDEQTSSGKLDIIIQLPYVIKSEARRQQAEIRRKDIETQLNGSKYGIAYTDGTERITQLNRPAENNLQGQIEYLTKQVYAQMGLTEEVFNGTASESVMLNYHTRTIAPILSAIAEGMKRTFLTKTARSQKQSIEFFRDVFSLASVESIANLGDKMTRNEILTSNEVRGIIGFKPATDAQADQLRNKNLPAPEQAYETEGPSDPVDYV